jgi:antirestriction protein
MIYFNSIIANLTKAGYSQEEATTNVHAYESQCDGNPSVYVGTYAKYNDGNLFGMWVDLTAFADFDDFINFCKDIHADEADPELMFQDYEGFPYEFYSECFGEETFNKIMKYVELCDRYDSEAVDAYCSLYGYDDDTLERFEERYQGAFDTEEEFAEHLVNECYDLDRTMGNLACYFDYAAFARDLFIDGYDFENGHVFCQY